MLRTFYIYILLSLFAIAYAVDGVRSPYSSHNMTEETPPDTTEAATLADETLPDTLDAAADTLDTDTLDTDTITADSIPQKTVQERIATLLEADMFQTSQVGLMAYDLTADTVIYEL